MSIVSYNMFPRFALFDRCYFAWANSIILGYLSLNNTRRYLFADLADIIIGEFCKGANTAQRMFNKTFCDSVELIMACRTPFKVCRNIISFVSINMIHLFKIMRVGAKRHCNKAVNTSVFNNTIKGKSDSKITTITTLHFQNSSVHIPNTFIALWCYPSITSWRRSYSAKIRNNMRFAKTNNRFPKFIHNKISFVPTLLQAWGNVNDNINKKGVYLCLLLT
jgi:hypothetical protein